MKAIISKVELTLWDLLNKGMTSSPLVKSIIRIGYPYYEQAKSNSDTASMVIKSALIGFAFGILMFLITLTWS